MTFEEPPRPKNMSASFISFSGILNGVRYGMGIPMSHILLTGAGDLPRRAEELCPTSTPHAAHRGRAVKQNPRKLPCK